jgi:hypothetical protein
LSSGTPNLQFIAIRVILASRLGTMQAYKQHLHRELIMNIAKNMEFIFVSAIVLIGGTSMAAAKSLRPPVRTIEPPAVVATVKTLAALPVVVVSAKRLSAAEKAAL